MKRILVLGSGCPKCLATAELVRREAERLGIQAEVEKVTDMPAILSYGVMSTPAVVIDGKLVHAGGLPRASDVRSWLTA